MESKLQKNLYFAGEVLNVDGFTGGFRLQICWASGYVTGKDIATNLYNEVYNTTIFSFFHFLMQYKTR